MRPVQGKTLILDAPPLYDDGDQHFLPEQAPARLASERLFSLSPSEIALLKDGGAVRIRQDGFRLEFDIAAAEEIQR